MTDYRVGYVIEPGGEPLAVFLDSVALPGKFAVYAQLGEHAEADLEYLRAQPLAGEAEYRDLHAYLSRRYAESPGEPPLRLVIDQAGVPR